jgi:hypothetical protein
VYCVDFGRGRVGRRTTVIKLVPPTDGAAGVAIDRMMTFRYSHSAPQAAGASHVAASTVLPAARFSGSTRPMARSSLEHHQPMPPRLGHLRYAEY